MNIESVKSVFSLLSGENDVEPLMPFITLAAAETEAMLNDNADEVDIRPDFLCAAVANYRFQQARSAHSSALPSYTGRLSGDSDSNTLRYAELLLSDYMNMCGSLIKPKSFVFMCFGQDKEGIYNA